MDTIIGFILILAVLEATRRTYGLLLPGLVVISLLYGHFGKLSSRHLPSRGIQLAEADSQCNDLSVWYFWNGAECFGHLYCFVYDFWRATGVQRCGAVFHQYRDCLGGKTRSGAAQAAVIGSGLVGSINGSAVANVASTGTFTIPMMKDRGYERIMRELLNR